MTPRPLLENTEHFSICGSDLDLADLQIDLGVVLINHTRHWGSMSKPRTIEAPKRRSLYLPQSVWDALGDYRITHCLSSRGEAARRVLEAGLTALASEPVDQELGNHPSQLDLDLKSPQRAEV